MDISTEGIIAIGENGIETTNRESIKQYLVERFRANYGANAEIGIGTEDDNMLELLADLFNDMGVVAVTTANGYSLSTAMGFQLDNIANIYYGNIRRSAGKKSTIRVTLTGTPNTTINGGQLKDAYGGVWDLPNFTFSSAGSFTATASHSVVGAYRISEEQIGGSSAIATPNPNWTGVTAVDGSFVLGENEETDTQFRARLAEEQYLTSITTTSSLISSLLSLQETVGGEVENLITKVSIWENDTSAEKSFSSAGLTDVPPHSLVVSVKARDDYDATYQKIGEAIYANKGQGVGTYAPNDGTTNKKVKVDPYGDYDEISQTQPLSQVEVNFVSAQARGTNIYITVSKSPTSILSTTANDIEEALKDVIASKLAEKRIGDTLQGNELVSIVQSRLASEYENDFTLSGNIGIGGASTYSVTLPYSEYFVLGTITVTIS